MQPLRADAEEFRVRSHQPPRLEAFVDAAFAFALFLPFREHDSLTPALPGFVYFGIWIVLPLLRWQVRRSAAIALA